MLETLQGELIYIWYYFDIQLRQILVYWVLGTTAMLLHLIERIESGNGLHTLEYAQKTGLGSRQYE